MNDKKEQISVLLTSSALNKIKSMQAIEPLKNASRNKVIEEAVSFYFSYITSELSQQYLCSVIGSKVDGLINSATDRLARLEFKEATEINLLTRLIASHFDIDKTTYDKMRKTAVEDVKATKGIINIYDAQR